MVVKWPTLRVEAEVSQLRERDGLHGELTWWAVVPGQGRGHLHWAAINLSSTISRNGMSKELERRAQEHGLEIAWHELLEQVAVFSRQVAREGEPFLRIGGPGDPKTLCYRLERLLQERQITVLFGDGGVGKSWIAIAAALSIEDGLAILDLEPTPGPVVYLDYETDSETLEERLRWVGRGFEMRQIPTISYRRMKRALADDLLAVKRFVAAEGAGLVIVDSLGLACGGEPESAEVVLRLFGALRELDCTVLGIDHISTAMQEKRGSRRPFGSVYKTNTPRATWEMRGSQEEGSAELRVALYNRKVNNGPRQRPLGYRLRFDNERSSLLIEADDPKKVLELAEGLSVSDRLRRALGEIKRGTTSTLADLAGAPIGQVRVRLSEMETKGEILCLRGGPKDEREWALLDSEHDLHL